MTALRTVIPQAAQITALGESQENVDRGDFSRRSARRARSAGEYPVASIRSSRASSSACAASCLSAPVHNPAGFGVMATVVIAVAT